MQWLIDIIKEWVIAQGYLTTACVNRGDPAAVDFTHIDLITDDAWHELDLSGIIPANAKMAVLVAVVKTMTVGSSFRIRPWGHVNDQNKSVIMTIVSNVYHSGDWQVFLAENRKIEYKTSDVIWSPIQLHVKGWCF